MSKELNKKERLDDAPSQQTSQSVLTVVTAALGAVGTLYLATGSIAVTVIGAVVAILSAALYLAAAKR